MAEDMKKAFLFPLKVREVKDAPGYPLKGGFIISRFLRKSTLEIKFLLKFYTEKFFAKSGRRQT